MNKQVPQQKISLYDYVKLNEQRNASLVIESIQKGLSPLLESKSAKELYNNLAFNPSAKNIYKGTNVLVLDTQCAMNDYNQNAWLTFNQAKELGASIKKGEKSSNVVFFSKAKTDNEIKLLLETQDLDDDEIKKLKKGFLKSYSVFNLSQIDFKDRQKPEFIPHFTPKSVDIKYLEQIAKSFDRDDLSMEYRVLRNQVAKYIAAKDFGDNYEVLDIHKELMNKAIQTLSLDEIQKAITDGSKISFSLYNQDNKYVNKEQETAQYKQEMKNNKSKVEHGQEVQYTSKESFQNKADDKARKDFVNKEFDKLIDYMKSKGKGFFQKDTWDHVFRAKQKAYQDKDMTQEFIAEQISTFKVHLDSIQPHHKNPSKEEKQNAMRELRDRSNSSKHQNNNVYTKHTKKQGYRK